MKKIFAFLFILSTMMFAQQTFIDTTSAGAETKKYVSTKYDASHAPLPVQYSAKYFFKPDTLTKTDSMKTYYFNGQYFFGFLSLNDTSDASSWNDTIVVQRYDSTSGTWKTKTFALRNVFTRVWESNNSAITAGNGNMYTWEISEPLPRTYRVYALNAYKLSTTRKIYIVWAGKY